MDNKKRVEEIIDFPIQDTFNTDDMEIHSSTEKEGEADELSNEND